MNQKKFIKAEQSLEEIWSKMRHEDPKKIDKMINEAVNEAREDDEKKSFVEFMDRSLLQGLDLNLKRDKSKLRKINL
jgi:hypothetical protein